MKAIYVLIFFGLASLTAHAERKDVTGSVGKIKYHEASSELATGWQKGVWFQLIDSSEQFCTDNKVSIPEGNEIAISMLLAAKMANNQILVTVEDTIKYPAGNTHCKLQYLTII